MFSAKIFSVKSLTVAAAFLTLSGAAITIPVQSADAQVHYGWRGGGWRGGWHGGWRGGYRPYYGYRPVIGGYYGPRWGGYPYRRAYWGGGWGYGYGFPYGGYFGGPYYGFYGDGGAVAAGLIGGLALGAITAAATRPAYYAPAYAPAYNHCFFERRRIIRPNGTAVVRRVRSCY